MRLKLIRHLWGIDLPWEQSFPEIKADGFAGVEAPMPSAEDGERFKRLIHAHGFEFRAMAFTGGANVREHLASLRAQLQRAQQCGATHVTAHSGSDAWSLDQAEEYFMEAMVIEKQLGLEVAHETHRGRLLFNPWQTRDVLAKCRGLRLCCDLSHWVVVAERLLGDCDAIIRAAADHCVHVHARVGYEQGPQVPDPSAPEYAPHLAAHEQWWDTIWASQRARGMTESTLTPEFGPPGYLHTLPHTNAPVADLWKIVKWMADRQAKRFAAA